MAAQARGLSSGAGLLLLLGAGAFGIRECTFNVEGGHRAIVFNRFYGIKELVRWAGEVSGAAKESYRILMLWKRAQTCQI